MLSEVLETFIVCCKNISEKGLVITNRNSVTGKNQYVDIRDKSITKADPLMNELGLTPKSRLPIKPKPTLEFESLLRGPGGEMRPTHQSSASIMRINQITFDL